MKVDYRKMNIGSQVMLEALVKIAAFNDTQATEQLRENGSYSLFDEPHSVEIARDALEFMGYEP